MNPSSRLVDKYMFAATHPDYQGMSIDFSEFWFGAPDAMRGPGSKSYLGGFRGRPLLADAMISSLRAIAGGALKPKELRSHRSHLRNFWRFLDAIEAKFSGVIDSLEDVAPIHGALWIKPDSDGTWSTPSYGMYHLARHLIEISRHAAGLTAPLLWPTIDPPVPPRPDVMSEAQARALYIELKHRAYNIYARWETADKLASIGRNVLKGCVDTTLTLTLADAHATYRAVILETGDAVPSAAVLRKVLGYPSNRRMFPIHLAELEAGLYPTLADLEVFFYLFLVRSGWNPQTVLDIDTSSVDWAVPLGDPTANLWHLQSFKTRGKNWQDTVCSGKPTTGAYQIIRRLLMRTAPLRAMAMKEPRRCRYPTIAERSPWLSGSNQAGCLGVAVLPPGAMKSLLRSIVREHNEDRTRRYATRLAEITAPHTQAPAPPVLIPENVKMTDFRDVYITHSFVESQYNWIVAMWAAGHKCSASTRRYLRSRAWRAHTEKAFGRFNDVLFEEIEVHHIVDPTVLRARCEGHEISNEQRDRWMSHKGRTYVGAACEDPFNPPAEIDPTNPLDGHSICRSQTRCTFCHHGMLFWDSMPRLARRLAELEVLQGAMSLAAWTESTLAIELTSISVTLDQWPRVDVATEMERWRRAIREGTHRVLSFSGVHRGH